MVLCISPSNTEAWAYRGWMKRNAGDTDGALADLDEALLLDPAHPDALVFRSSVRLRTGDLDGARTDLRALDAGSPDPQILGLVQSMGLRADIVADTLLAEDAPSLAESGFTAAEAADAGIARALAGELVPAAQLLDLVVAVEPDNVPALTYRGFIRAIASGNEPALADEAESQLDRALELEPNYPDALAIRAVFRQAVRDDPEGAQADAAAYEATGDQTPHLRDYLRANGLIS